MDEKTNDEIDPDPEYDTFQNDDGDGSDNCQNGDCCCNQEAVMTYYTEDCCSFGRCKHGCREDDCCPDCRLEESATFQHTRHYRR
jgi:hypothetical protein